MGSIQSKICAHKRAHPNSIAPMGTEQTRQTERQNIPDDYTSGSLSGSMGSNLSQSNTHTQPNFIAPMDANQTPQTELRNIPDDYTSGSPGTNQSKTHARPNSIAPMDAEQSSQTKPRTIPDLQFRVLVIGKANAGKTSILQRVCDTTESPTIYRQGKDGRKKVRGPHFVCESDLTANQFKLEPSMDVSDTSISLRLLIDIVPARRAHHRR